MKPIIFEHGPRTFKVFVGSAGCGLADVNIYEYRPNGRIVKWAFRDTYSFWVDDYATIEEGARAKLGKFLNEEAERLAIAKKWSEFYAKY